MTRFPTGVSLFLALLSASSTPSTVVAAFSLNGAAAKSKSVLSSSSLPMAKAAVPDDIVARARERAGVVEEEEFQSLFTKELRVDMAEVLTKLERRVKEGPGALSVLEVETLQHELGRILDEMKANEHNKPPRPPREEASDEKAPSRPPPVSSSQSLLHADPDAIATLNEDSRAAPSENVRDASQDEGPAFDGRGGMGQPRGTVNTYIIPGMDEMNAEGE